MNLIRRKIISYLFVSLMITFLFVLVSCEEDEIVKVVPVSNLPAGCDTLAVTYSGTIKAIMAGNCTDCHGSLGGVNLESYNNVRKYAMNGDIISSIDIKDQIPGGMRIYMSNKSKVDCQIFQIKAWINKGAPND